MFVIIIGGTGHVGTYLVPRLIEAGHEVIAVSRQERSTYQSNPAWNIVQQVQINQRKRETLAIKFVD